MRFGLPRPKLPDRIITDCYAPPRGPKPPRVEVSAPGVDEVKHIMRRWEPFHRGESMADRMIGSCSRHGSWRGLHGERSCRDLEGRHPADYR